MVSAWNLVCGRFINFKEGRSILPLLTFGCPNHNFWMRNPSRSSKVSKESDLSLVSNKNLSKILPSNGLGPGPGEVGQVGLKVLHLWHHSQRIGTPQPKKIFLQTPWLVESFERLNSFLVLNTFAAGLIQAVRKKQLFRTWLCGWISPLLFALATRRKSQKTWSV